MKRLIIVRHGTYGPDKQLNEKGRREIFFLGGKLQTLLQGMRVVILSSDAPRAKESADILGEHLGVGVTVDPILYSNNEEGRWTDVPRAFGLISQHGRDADAVIVVTHAEYSDALPDEFMWEQYGMMLGSKILQKGEACLIDCETKKLVRV